MVFAHVSDKTKNKRMCSNKWLPKLNAKVAIEYGHQKWSQRTGCGALIFVFDAITHRLIVHRFQESFGCLWERLKRYAHVAFTQRQRFDEQSRCMFEILKWHTAGVFARNRDALKMRHNLLVIERNVVAGMSRFAHSNRRLLIFECPANREKERRHEFQFCTL